MLHLWIDVSALTPDARAEVERSLAAAAGGVGGIESGRVRDVHRRGALLEVDVPLTFADVAESLNADELDAEGLAGTLDPTVVHAGCVADDELDDRVREAEDDQRIDDAAEVAQILEHLAKLDGPDQLREFLAKVAARREKLVGRRGDALDAALAVAIGNA